MYQRIPNTASIPRGDLDAATCKTDITALQADSCSGAFQYKYVVKNMLGKGFAETVWYNVSNNIHIANGTTAYATTWSTGNANKAQD